MDSRRDSYIVRGLDSKLLQRIESARRQNRERDAIDRGAAFAAPRDCPLDVQLRTVLDALAVGLNLKDWGIVCEAVAILQDTELQARRH